MKFALPAFLILFACTSFAEEIVTIETVTASLESGAPVRINNINGDIEVTGWESDQVEVTYTVTCETQEDMDAVDVVINTENGLICEVEIDSDLRESVDCQVDFLVSVPSDIDLNYLIENINGDISFSDADGTSEISLINGEVEVGEFTGDMSVEVVNGSIAVEDVPRMKTMELVNGSIVLAVEELLGDMSIETVNGEVQVQLGADALVAIETLSGDIDIAGAFDVAVVEDLVGSSAEFGNGEFSILISTVNGDIEVTE